MEEQKKTNREDQDPLSDYRDQRLNQSGRRSKFLIKVHEMEKLYEETHDVDD